MGRPKPGGKSDDASGSGSKGARKADSRPGGLPSERERRRHRRIATAVPFKIVNEAGQEEPFDLVDLSESGARIRCSHAVPPMTRIQVALLLPGRKLGLAKDVRVDTSGVVVWSHRASAAERPATKASRLSASEGGYDTGVFFPDLEDEQRSLLRTLVNAAD